MTLFLSWAHTLSAAYSGIQLADIDIASETQALLRGFLPLTGPNGP